MRKRIRINYIFWKEGPLLFDAAQSKLQSLLARKHEIKQSQKSES